MYVDSKILIFTKNSTKFIINEQASTGTFIPGFIAHAPRGAVVILCVCVSATKLAAIYLVCESKLWCYKVCYGVPNVCIVWNPFFSFDVIY